MMDAATRAAAAQRLLREHGIAAAKVDVAGHEGEIAAVDAPTRFAPTLAALAPEIKALGFRYVALELMPGEARD